MVLGHSLGEYVAGCIAGVFSLEEALTLAYERGRLMGGLPRNGSMLAVRASEAVMSQAIGPLPRGVSVAALNGPESIVLSGRAEEIARVSQASAEKGIKAQPLTVSHAFHSPMMDPMLDEFEQQAAKAQLSGSGDRICFECDRAPARVRRADRRSLLAPACARDRAILRGIGYPPGPEAGKFCLKLAPILCCWAWRSWPTRSCRCPARRPAPG